MKIEGKGYLINANLNKNFPAEFEVEQIDTGKISGKCTLSGFGDEDFLTQSQLKDCRIIEGRMIKSNFNKSADEYIPENFHDCYFEGNTRNGEKVSIKHIWVDGIHTLGAKVDLKFSAEEVELSYDIISPEDQLFIEYGIINIDLGRLNSGYIKTGIGKITLSKLEDHEEVIEKMKIFKTPLLSGVINIKAENISKFDSFESYFKEVDETVAKILELLSLAQSTYLSYCSIRICSKPTDSSDLDEFETKKLILLDLKTKTPNLGEPLIQDWEDVREFISNTFAKYSDVLKKYDFNIALEWYLDSLISGVLQSKYLMACTCFELLKDRYNKIIAEEYILEKAFFSDKIYPNLKENMKEILKENGIDKDTAEHKRIRAEIYANLKGVNRISFTSSLLRLLDDLQIIHNDLFRDINMIAKIRNQITHRGIQKMDPKELLDFYEKTICLIQRIFLALLGYDGYFLDRNDGYKRKKFTNFITEVKSPENTY
ncbi:MAG: hypothetical protein JW878_01710 [Methanomicrobia archaeon]|nr:hypothetical protein [Methanomicrobia archaeon]